MVYDGVDYNCEHTSNCVCESPAAVMWFLLVLRRGKRKKLPSPEVAWCDRCRILSSSLLLNSFGDFEFLLKHMVSPVTSPSQQDDHHYHCHHFHHYYSSIACSCLVPLIVDDDDDGFLSKTSKVAQYIQVNPSMWVVRGWMFIGVMFNCYTILLNIKWTDTGE